MKINSMIKRIVLFTLMTLFATSVFSAPIEPSCTHTPTSVTLTAGGAPQSVTYECNGMQGLPSGRPFMLQFNASPNVQITAPNKFSYPYTVQVSSTVPGNYSITVSKASIGGAWNPFIGANPPLTVAVNTLPVPAVTGLSVSSGPTAGGNQVTIRGSNFTPAATVKFGSIAATNVIYTNSSTLTATAPRGAGTVDVTVTTVNGTSAISSLDRYTYLSAPTVTSLSTNSGPTSGGTVVDITGTNFTEDSTVRFGSNLATNVVYHSATSLTATSPAGAGLVNVRVDTAGGSSAITPDDQFTYSLAPAVTHLSVSSGPLGGGTSVTITGTNFTSVSTVKFGAASAASVTYNSATSLTAVSPAGTGTVHVTVTTAGGTSATSSADQFTYKAFPTVTNLSVSTGSAAGGTSVTITGTNFTSSATVKFGTRSATNVTYNSATSLTVTSPSGTGIVNVTVTTVNGTSATVPADQFTYQSLPVPTVTHLSVSSGALSGGTLVTITGTNFTPSATVKFGTANATSVTYNSATSLTVTSPAGTGTVDIRVTTTGGTSAASSADQFTYQAVPAVTHLSVSTGPAAGGTSVTITGANFTPSATVKFGTVSATSVTYNSATSLTAVSPAGTGIVNVTVTTAVGTSTMVPADQFTYQATPLVPTVISLSLSSGSADGGTRVTIVGTNFTPSATVKFGAVDATSVTYNSANSLTVVSPSGTGTVDVTVTTAGGTSATSSADQFTYENVPTLTHLSVTTGPAAGGTSVTITGTNFTSSATVKFGTANATSVTYNSSTSLTVTSPSGIGIVDVTVTTTAGTSAVVPADQFTYQSTPAPSVTHLSVSSGALSGGTTVTVTGTNFTPSATVKFGTIDATSVTYNSSTSLTVTSPAGTGTVDVTVTTAGGTSATSSADQFTYQPVPSITNLSVSSGPTGGGTSVTITGTNFTPSSTVKFGAVSAGAVTYHNNTSLTVTAPPGTGIVNVRVTTVGGTSAITSADQFTYLALPSVTRLSVSAGPTGGGTSVTITGTNFTSASTVEFGTTNATSVTYNSATSLTVVSPVGTGTVDVTVTTTAGTSGTSPSDQFTYVAAPTVTSLSVGNGPASGGTTVVITGLNFTSTATVKFGTTPAASVSYISATSLSVTSPAGSGTVDVTVTTSGGTSAITSADHFYYQPLLLPTVTHLSPPSGPTGTSVTITGTAFTPSATVKFGATSATGVTYNSATSLTATAPAGSGIVDVTVTTSGGTSATSSADRFTYTASSDVTGVVQTNTQCTQVNFPVPVGGSGIICNVVYTNTGSTNISNPQFSGTILAPGAGTVVPSPGQCPLLNGGGGSCTETYTYTPVSGTYPLPNNMQLVIQMNISSSTGSLLASVNQTMQFKPLVGVSNSAPWTCTPTQLVWGGTSTCSLALNSIDTSFYPQHGVLAATATTGGSFGSTTPQSIAFSSASPITKVFTYTAPTSGSSQTISLGLNYSDEIGDTLTIPPVSVTVGPPVTISGIRCNPDPATASNSVSCNVILTNIGTSAITINTPVVSMGGQSVTPSAACLTNLAAGGNCTVTFGTTASSSAASMAISVAPASSGPGFQTESITLPIYSSSRPQIQANPIVCNIDSLQLPIGGGADGSMHCSILFANLGATSATGVVITPTVTPGDGTITPDTTPMVCSNSTLGTMAQNDTCSYGFTYTTPVAPTSDNSALISVGYSDNEGGDTGSVAFLQPVSVSLQNSPNALIAASVIPDTSNVMPANNVIYNSTTPVPVIFHFLNSTGSKIDYNTPEVVTITNGVVSPVSTNAIDLSNSSCYVNSSLSNKAGCNLTVDFQPNLANGFKTGDHVALMAWLPGSAEGDSLIASWNITIGQPPIFAEVYTNSPFIAGQTNPNGFQGAFIFGNNSGATLTGVQPVRAFLPAGIASTNSCFAGVATKYPGIVSCGSLGGTMAANQSCYSCFTAALSSYPANTSLSFQAELSYDQSVSESSRVVPVTPSYRTITLNNMCSSSVWPAFVSGAAYYSCTQDSDCPTGTVCYKPGSQCMVPPSTPYNNNNGCPAGDYPVPKDFPGGGGCSKGCNDVNVGPGSCPNLSSCNPSNGLCYWTLPTQQSGSLTSDQELPANKTAVMQIPNSPLLKNGDWSTVWSGGLIPRTGCTGSGATLSCATAPCETNSDGTCKLGHGPKPPATQAEFTFLYTNQDYYDVEVINGFSIPVSMTPGDYALNPAPAVATSPYICSAAGLQLTTNGTSSGNVNQCSWDYVMNSYDLMSSATPTAYPAHFQALHTFVTDGGGACTPGVTSGAGSCSTGLVCGISMANSVMTPSANPVPSFTCGSLVGFWSGNQICADNANLDYKDPSNSTFELNCAAPAGGSYGGASMQQWLGCNGGSASGSCYASNAASGSCCGCPYWSAGVTGSPEKTTAPSTYFQTLFPSGFVLSPNGSDDYCQANSSAWTQHVQGPELTWMKQGCASVYTFAYDDPTSTFVCSSNSVVGGQVQNPQGKVNTQNYTVTFCPGTTASPTGYSGSVNGVPVDESATNSFSLMKSRGQKHPPSVSLWQFFSNHMHNLERKLYAN